MAGGHRYEPALLEMRQGPERSGRLRLRASAQPQRGAEFGIQSSDHRGRTHVFRVTNHRPAPGKTPIEVERGSRVVPSSAARPSLADPAWPLRVHRAPRTECVVRDLFLSGQDSKGDRKQPPPAGRREPQSSPRYAYNPDRFFVPVHSAAGY
jgi:hypothetical protein